MCFHVKLELLFYDNSYDNISETPNPDEPVGAKRKSRFIGELKIEDCKLNICGCRCAPSFLKWKEFLKYSIVTRQ